ncbi:MAG: prolyl oligopeptidase family serine peptidase [Bacteroidetes Order II. Incertae sedis bacterium]|nr:prolyl oligopeptidase family serine peptidase [Bacteroidetes Order II. bacterium]
MLRIFPLLRGILTVFLLYQAGCDLLSPEDESGRGSIVSSSLVWSKTKEDLTNTYNEQLPIQLGTFGVDTYKVVYNTVDAEGKPTIASGLVQFPTNTGSLKNYPMLVEFNGTITHDDQAPTRSSFYPILTSMYATSGYIVVVPDHLGFGDNPQTLHPYVHAGTTVTVSVDLMRAARKLASEKGFKWNKKVFITGYSQGGYSALALHRGLDDEYSSEFPVSASAPMAGPYSLAGAMADMILAEKPHPNPFYLPYLLLAYNDIYKFGPTDADYLNAPYSTTLRPLYNRKHFGGEINQSLPAIPLQVLKTEFLNDFKTNPNNGLRKALKENERYDWKPKAPIHFYHCSGDADVPQANSKIAYDKLKANGATVTLTDPAPGEDHGGCFIQAFFASKGWIAEQNINK